jgi:large subunit ribosomal protein L25
VELRGTPEGLSEGAFVSQILREVAIECLPTDIPSCIIGDVSGLGIGESLDAGKLQIPRDVELITPVTETVVTIAVPTVAAVKEETEEEIEGDQVSEPKIEA